jgi:predicted nucleic acid-binding protein
VIPGRDTLLVDTSLWIAHLHKHHAGLAGLLQDGLAVCHPFIIGEVACGSIRNRAEILSLLRALPSIAIVSHDEALRFLDTYRLMGTGLGWVDVHLLAGALASNVGLWTLDRPLRTAARRLGLTIGPEQYPPSPRP